MPFCMPAPQRWIASIILPLALCSEWIHSQETPPIAPVSPDTLPSIQDAVEAHLGYVTDYCLDEYGKDDTGIWLGQIDIRTSKLPSLKPDTGSTRPATAWTFGNLYLDQPTMVAAVEMGRRTGCKCYQDSITRYLGDQLERMLPGTSDPFQMLLSSDYDLIRDEFVSSDQSWTTWNYLPAWEILARESPESVRVCFNNLLNRTNALHRKLNKNPQNPISISITELWMARSITVASLSWMENHFEEESESWRQKALALTQLSDIDLKIFKHLPAGVKASWLNAVTSHPSLASQLSETQQRRLLAPFVHETGVPSDDQSQNEPPPESKTPSSKISSIEGELRYAEACLTAWTQTKHLSWLEQARSKLPPIETSLKDPEPSFTTAGTYGRVIHFMNRYGQLTNEDRYQILARHVADQAMQTFYEPRLGMFRSRSESNLCDSRDGIGFLLLALLALDGDDPTITSSLRF